MFEKNSVKYGGSFYIQSKIHTAKEFLMKDFPVDFEEKYKREHGFKEKEEKEE